MTSVHRLILLNQMAGPLFRQLAEGLATCYPAGAQLVTGHPDTLTIADKLGGKLEVVAAPCYDRRSRFRRVWSWLHYLFSVTGRILFARKGDALLLVSNPPLLGPWVWLLSFLRPVPYGVLVYDIYPDVLEHMGLVQRGSLLSRIWRAINCLVFCRARVVITIGARMARRLQRQVDPNDAKVLVVPPWADVEMIKPLKRAQNPYTSNFIEPEDIVVLYSGNMGASHDIESILAAAESLQGDRRIRFLFIGEGEKKAAVEAYIGQFPESNVRLFPFQAEAMLPFTLTLADISLVTLDEGMEELMVPSKFFSYLAGGSAILAISNDESELSDLMDHSRCGMRVPPRQPEKIVAALLKMIGDPAVLVAFKRQARLLAEQHYSRRVGIKLFVDNLERSGIGPALMKDKT